LSTIAIALLYDATVLGEYIDVLEIGHPNGFCVEDFRYLVLANVVSEFIVRAPQRV
jgi:hypothetical protein